MMGLEYPNVSAEREDNLHRNLYHGFEHQQREQSAAPVASATPASGRLGGLSMDEFVRLFGNGSDNAHGNNNDADNLAHPMALETEGGSLFPTLASRREERA